MSDKKVHLLCSSGGVRCYSYIGAYKALHKAGYTVSGVSASSMGSVIGLLFCMGLTPEQVEEKILNNSIKKYLRKRFWLKQFALLRYPYAMYHQPDYAAMLKDFVDKDPDPVLETLGIPFSTLALDLNKNQLLSISKDTHPGWKASKLLSVATAIPPLFAPVPEGDMLLVDAAIASESPGWIATAESDGHPVVVLKNSAGLSDGNKKNFSKFISSMIQSAAAATDAFSLQKMPASIMVDINCGAQKAEQFNISNARIKALILAGEKAMEQILAVYKGDLSKFIKTENIIPKDDKASERNIALFQDFSLVTAGRHQVFISYSHLDEDWFTKLKLVLAPVKVFHGIKFWDDKEIPPGANWHEAIKAALSRTRVAICLVSQNFLNSDYINNTELEYFIKEAKDLNVQIFAIAISSVKENPLTKYQFVNNVAEPFDKLSDEKQFAILNKMVDQLIEFMNKEKKS
jgi:predicted acylesterase/phospholipase RssA